MTTYFSIVSMGRSGSTYLERLLASHPDITSLGEAVGATGAYSQHAHMSIREFIQSRLFGNRDGICGFKMPFDNILTHPDVFGAFHDLSFRLIYLWRRNKLDQFLSVKLAQKTGVWASDATYGDQTVNVSVDELREFFITSAYADAVLQQMCQRFPHIAVAYEDIASGKHHGELQDFLGADIHVLTTDTVRSRENSRRASIENYDELARSFSGTPQAGFFSEQELLG